MFDFFTNRTVRAAAVGLMLLSLITPRSWAWGHEGHRLTALVAETYLTPEAKAQVADLLHKETLADVASWADTYRRNRGRGCRAQADQTDEKS
jgi:hypothetical protein